VSCHFLILAAQQQMSLVECEEAFQKNNLQLLAEQYNINMADADILQAKIWELPQLSGQFNAYNPQDKKFFDVGHSKGAGITQLIYMGGKKKNEIAFAKSNKEISSASVFPTFGRFKIPASYHLFQSLLRKIEAGKYQ
jgi:cobalt-zinc-cadmium efflux system outer membrane protein